MFVHKAVNRFRQGEGEHRVVDAWQIFNEYEAGFAVDWCPSDQFSEFCVNDRLTQQWLQEHGLAGAGGIYHLPPPRVYAEMVHDAARVVHLVDPDAVVVLGSPWESDLYLDNFPKTETERASNWYSLVLKTIEDLGYSNEIRGTGLHAYGTPNRPYDFMKRLHDAPPDWWGGMTNKPFWMTESGVQDETGQTANCRDYPCAHPQEMGSYIIQNYAWALRGFNETSGPGKIFHFSLQPLPDRDFGLFDRLGNPRPAYYAYALVTSQLKGAEYHDIEEQSDHVQMTFKRDDGAWATAAWSTEDHAAEANVPLRYEGAGCATLWEQNGYSHICDAENTFCTVESNSSVSFRLPRRDPLKPSYNIGGPTYILVETDEPCKVTPPQGEAAVICENGRAVGTDLQGYDADSGLASLSYACSPEKTYDLSWTEPGRTYAGPVYIAPPEDTACTLTDERASESASGRIGESAISRPAVLLYRHTILVYADGETGYSSLIVHLVIVNCPPPPAYASA
jgi:hypothetical protein